MRPLALTFLALAALSALAAEPTAYPLWDGQETIAEYAKRTGLEPTKTLDLGNGVKLELVLIPAGKFVMGTPEPESTWIGGTLLGTAGLLALVLLAVLVIRAIRQRRRPQFSLQWLILIVLLFGVVQYGGFRWWQAREDLKSFYYDIESPAHEVVIGAPFYLSKFEAMQEQYEQVIGENPSLCKGPDLPVTGVSWNDAQEFCKKVCERASATCRLPSEAEWEYACRSGTKTLFCLGNKDADLESMAWYADSSGGATHPVGKKTPNTWGIYDMHGNVYEWCEDEWHDNYDGAPSDGKAWVDSERAVGRVLRGGCYSSDVWYCRSAFRLRCFPDNRKCNVGFRVVVVPDHHPSPPPARAGG